MRLRGSMGITGGSRICLDEGESYQLIGEIIPATSAG